MQPDTICKTVRQYSSMAVEPENMQKLQEIANDYTWVKNYVYERYGGIGGLSKIYPGYTVQNEMTKSGLREERGLPAVYFYLAVFDALGDIKAQWTRVKGGVLEAVRLNEAFTSQDRHYLRFVMKVSACFEGILTGREVLLTGELRTAFEKIAAEVNHEKLNRYLCRQVRKRLRRLHTEKADGFAMTERAYRYGDNGKNHGIYISTKEKRRRIFIPLTDSNRYSKQLYVKWKPATAALEILVPVEVKIQRHPDYRNEIGLSLGMQQMFTTDGGRIYGERLGELHRTLVEIIKNGERARRKSEKESSGRIKYESKRDRQNAKLTTYINQEINRMLREEKPAIIYLPRLPGQSKAGPNREINCSVNLWKKGYIRKRLELKCRENGIERIEVMGNAISTECSRCGRTGFSTKEVFSCGYCGHQENKKVNAARNAKNRGRCGRQVYKKWIPKNESGDQSEVFADKSGSSRILPATDCRKFLDIKKQQTALE